MKILNKKYENELELYEVLKKIDDPEILFDLMKKLEYKDNDGKLLNDIQLSNFIKMAIKNREVWNDESGITFNEELIKIMGVERVSNISCFRIESKKLSNILKEKNGLNQILQFERLISNYEKVNNTSDWQGVFIKLLENRESYIELFESMNSDFLDNMDEVKKVKTLNIVLNLMMNEENLLDITNIEQIYNIDEIKEKICSEKFGKINENPDKEYRLEEKKEIILYSKFGISKNNAISLIKKFGMDISSIQEEDLKYEINSINMILKLKNENELNEIFEKFEPIKMSDKCSNIVSLEKKLKRAYFKLYSEKVFNPEEHSKNIELSEKLGTNVYDIPFEDENGEINKNFGIIINNVKALVHGWEKIPNYYNEWNQPTELSPHFCASYITNEMMATAPYHSIGYGFSRLSDDSIRIMSNTDSDSNCIGLDSEGTEPNVIKFLSPECLINETKLTNERVYNELDIRRSIGKDKIMPNYIVVFKSGISENLHISKKQRKIASKMYENRLVEAQRASKEFEKNGIKLPIVIIDQDRILELEKEEINNLINEYNDNPSNELEERIQNKIKNNELSIMWQKKKEYSSIGEYPNLDITFDGKIKNKVVNKSVYEKANNETKVAEKKKVIDKIKSRIMNMKTKNNYKEK